MTLSVRVVVPLFFGLIVSCQSVSKLDKLQFADTSADGGKLADAAVDDTPTGRPSETEMSAKTEEVARCRVVDGAECDPVRQCGCDTNKVCRASGAEDRAKCSDAGDAKPWSACSIAQQCPMSQTCDRGSCRPYCATDADCEGGSCLPARATSGSTSENFSVCWKHCETGDEGACAEGTSCRSIDNPFGDVGTYCVAPLDPCPSVDNGVCDDPTGNGLCAAGTDNHDCQCESRLEQSPCDPVSQCGCSEGSSCVAWLEQGTLLTWRAECADAGTGALNSDCERPADCAPGLFCDSVTNTCAKFCDDEGDCPGGTCSYISNDAGATFGRCRAECKAGDNSSCPEGNACVEIDAMRLTFKLSGMFKRSGHFCMPPAAQNTCPEDGVCDDPTGTRMCLAGADDKDCCSAPLPGGACDPYKRCGCADKPGTACVLTDVLNETACLLPGDLPPGSVCKGHSDQCQEGYGCFGNVCRKFCADVADCGGHPNVCVKRFDADMNVAKYGHCTSTCDPAAADSCPPGSLCAIVGDSGVTACWVPDPGRCGGKEGVCDDTRPGGRRLCELGTDTKDCCPSIADGAECDPEANCGCERKPGTHCVVADGESTASCQPIHPGPLSEACADVSDPSCCNPPIVGSECDPIQQCGCEAKPGTHCQTIDSDGVGACMKYGNLPPGSVCSSAFEQCSEGYDCHTWDLVCRKPCMEHTDCALTTDGITVAQFCAKAGGAIGHCMVSCDFETEAPCLPGTRCARFGEETTACFKSAPVCNLADNQTCDDTRPGGTRLCAYGKDPECN